MPPAAGMTYTSSLPSYSPVKAIIEPSGEKNRIDFNADVTRQPPGLSSNSIHDPQIAAVAERNLRLAHGGFPQKRVLVCWTVPPVPTR